MKNPLVVPEKLSYANRFGFPYRTTLNFMPYIEWLENSIATGNAPDASHFRQVINEVKTFPELLQPIEDLDVVERHREVVNRLLSTLIPSSTARDNITGIIIPFQPITLYATPRFTDIMGDAGKGKWDFSKTNPNRLLKELVANAGLSILDRYYEFDLFHPLMYRNREVEKMMGAQMFFQPDICRRYTRVKTLKTPKPLDQIDLTPLRNDFLDTEFWLKNFPPDTFAFEGLAVYGLTDISEREYISQLELTLLQSNSMLTPESRREMEQKLKAYLKIKDLSIGIAPFVNYRGAMTSCGMDSWYCLLPYQDLDMMMKHFENSMYSRAIESGNPMLIDDLLHVSDPTPIEKALVRHGYRSMILLPVFFNDQFIGMVELASKEPYALNFISLFRLKDITPFISAAFQRANDEMDNRIQATIKEYFTAIHPVVEWKFTNTAMNLLASGKSAGKELPVIQFDNVMPIYGQVDIRGSSEKRNEAIRLDMMDYLKAGRNVIKEAYLKYPLPVLDELIFRTDNFLQKISSTLDTGDESGITEFMHQEVEPSMRLIGERDPVLKQVTDRFFEALDPAHDFHLMRRRDFEKSLTMVNDVVSRLLEDEEKQTQQWIPHYFEKYQTDGVEYNIYLGQSLLQDVEFDPVYLKTFRLWQLLSMTRLARETHRLQQFLPVQLETTQLILCYSSPFSIMFRMDEKRFDVAGAYNIRYEIVKKRIDKAHVKGAGERITQPGTIAVIYSQEKEEKEYERFFEYLKSREYVMPQLDRLEVEPLQGLQGLKALRFHVNYGDQEPALTLDEEELLRQVKNPVAD